MASQCACLWQCLDNILTSHLLKGDSWYLSFDTDVSPLLSSQVVMASSAAPGAAAVGVSVSVDTKAELAALLDQWEREQQGTTEKLVSILTKSVFVSVLFCLYIEKAVDIVHFVGWKFHCSFVPCRPPQMQADRCNMAACGQVDTFLAYFPQTLTLTLLHTYTQTHCLCASNLSFDKYHIEHGPIFDKMLLIRFCIVFCIPCTFTCSWRNQGILSLGSSRFFVHMCVFVCVCVGKLGSLNCFMW